MAYVRTFDSCPSLMKKPTLLPVWLMIAVCTGVMVTSLAVTTSQHQTGQLRTPSVVVEVLDPSLENYKAMWQTEIGRRFPDAVAILCHGGDLESGRWVVKANDVHLNTVEDIVKVYQDKWPGRTLVVLACNPGHINLHMPGVYHAMDSVWCVPDRAVLDDAAQDHLTQTLQYGPLDPYRYPAPAKVIVHPRWPTAPTVVGNIFEFTDL